MGKIAVVHVASGWILNKIGQRICEAMPDRFESVPVNQIDNMEKDRAAQFEGWYYVDIQNCWMPMLRDAFPNVPHIGMFTHLHEDDLNNIKSHWLSLNGVVHMNSRYADLFESHGVYVADQQIVSRPGGDFDTHFEMKPLILGVSQRGSDSDGKPLPGKGNGFLQEAIALLSEEERMCICLCFKGNGWIPSDFDVSNAWRHDGEEYEDYYAFYHTLDYLLIPSLWEGGPMAALEAMYMGIPIISANVGWMPDLYRECGLSDFCVNLFTAGDAKGLANRISQLVRRKIRMSEVVKGMTHKKHAKEILSLFERIRNGKA